MDVRVCSIALPTDIKQYSRYFHEYFEKLQSFLTSEEEKIASHYAQQGSSTLSKLNQDIHITALFDVLV